MRLHAELRAEALHGAGMSADQARTAARRRFGNATALAETSRDIWGLGTLDQLTQDIRFAARRLRARPGFSAPVMAVLALGIGATTAVFSAVDAAMLRSLPFPREHELVSLPMVTVPFERALGERSPGRQLDISACSRDDRRLLEPSIVRVRWAQPLGSRSSTARESRRRHGVVLHNVRRDTVQRPYLHRRRGQAARPPGNHSLVWTVGTPLRWRADAREAGYAARTAVHRRRDHATGIRLSRRERSVDRDARTSDVGNVRAVPRVSSIRTSLRESGRAYRPNRRPRRCSGGGSRSRSQRGVRGAPT